MTVAVVYEGSLLTQGVRSLLHARDGDGVVSIDLGDGAGADRLRALKPSVIVVDADDVAFHSGALLDLLEDMPEVRVVCLHGGGDHLDVYRKTRVPVRDASDVAAAIGAA